MVLSGMIQMMRIFGEVVNCVYENLGMSARNVRKG